MTLQSGDILLSQAHILNHVFSFIKSMSLKSAVQLQIPDIIHNHGKPMTLSELVEALPVDQEKSPFVYRLMRFLVHSGFFLTQSILKTGGVEEEGEGYLLTPTSQILLKEHPLSIRPFVLAILDPMMMDPWQHLTKWFQSDDVNPFCTAHGKTLWNYAGELPQLNLLFNEAMAVDARLVTSVVLEKCADAFEGVNSIVDVGGGTGTVAKAIAKAFPNITCTVLDLPHVVDGLEGSKNLTYVGGDMFEAIPSADVVLLKSILHDWNDEVCVKLLKRCKDAISSKEKGGKLIIIDIVVKYQEGNEKLLETRLFADMQMMVTMTGKERNEKDWAILFRDACFSDFKITPILGLKSLIEAYP